MTEGPFHHGAHIVGADAAVAAVLVKNLGMTPKQAAAETLRLMKRRGE